MKHVDEKGYKGKPINRYTERAFRGQRYNVCFVIEEQDENFADALLDTILTLARDGGLAIRNFVAIRVPTPIQPSFDVWRHDGSEMWEGCRYVQVPNAKKGGYNPRTLYTPEFTHPKKCVVSWSNLGHYNREEKWVEAFEIELYNAETDESFDIQFHTPLLSLAPLSENEGIKRRRLDDV